MVDGLFEVVEQSRVKERERERERDRDRETDRDRGKDRETERQRDRDSETEGLSSAKAPRGGAPSHPPGGYLSFYKNGRHPIFISFNLSQVPHLQLSATFVSTPS